MKLKLDFEIKVNHKAEVIDEDEDSLGRKMMMLRSDMTKRIDFTEDLSKKAKKVLRQLRGLFNEMFLL